MPLTITLNGDSRTFDTLDPGATIAGLVQALELKPDRIAIEANGQIAPRARWSGLNLQQGDRVELVHFVGGGSPLYSQEQAQ